MRNVIVTGGSRGLGLAIGTQLARSGLRVIAVARKMTDELAAARELAAAEGPGAIEFRAADLADLGTLSSLVRGVRAEHGPIYGLVNNAGLGLGGLLTNMLDADVERLITLNTASPILLAKYAARSMMLERAGRIVNVASVVAATGYSGLSVYSATKAALVGFTRSLARELGQLGITVNAVSPGFISTEMTKDLTAEQREHIQRRSALRRLADPVDVARSVDFLMGESGRNITGTVITVDAGNTT